MAAKYCCYYIKENWNMEKILKDEKNAIRAAESHAVRQKSWTGCPVLGGQWEDIFLDQL